MAMFRTMLMKAVLASDEWTIVGLCWQWDSAWHYGW